MDASTKVESRAGVKFEVVIVKDAELDNVACRLSLRYRLIECVSRIKVRGKLSLNPGDI